MPSPSKAQAAENDRRTLLALRLWERPGHPSIRELATEADAGTYQAMHLRLQKLKRRGLVTRLPRGVRTYVLTDKGQELAETFIDSGEYTE